MGEGWRGDGTRGKISPSCHKKHIVLTGKLHDPGLEVNEPSTQKCSPLPDPPPPPPKKNNSVFLLELSNEAISGLIHFKNISNIMKMYLQWLLYVSQYGFRKTFRVAHFQIVFKSLLLISRNVFQCVNLNRNYQAANGLESKKNREVVSTDDECFSYKTNCK